MTLFDGRLGTQSVRVWIERRGRGIAVLSHDIGPGLDPVFGTDDIETFLEISGDHLDQVATALGDPTGDPMKILIARFTGDSAATTRLRQLLDDAGVPYRFHVA
jgi:hypothetical protein